MMMRKVRPYKALSIGFFSLVLLAGCGDNEPSSSDIKQQISAQLSPCPELSISDFQKINGYPQTDGSYIEQVQYTITFTPSNAMLDSVSDADKMSQNLTNGDLRSAVATDDDNAQLNRDSNALISDLKQDCPISVPGGALGVFNVDPDNPDSYGKTLSAQFSGNVHLVKSDNGWAIQN